jgi:2-amino-4-hydroxy-6-hydroxymethyldihydropteridine diphosphokinase
LPARVAIALGSNLGDRHAHLTWAIGRLHDHLSGLRASSFIVTEPIDVPDPQPEYLNAAVVGETSLTAANLMQRLLDLERERGRTRSSVRAARTLDLDLILYGDAIISEPGVTVPHPRFRERRFVLQPLAEIAPDWIDPVTGLTIAHLATRLDTDNM